MTEQTTEHTTPESDESVTLNQESETEQPETEGEPTEAENDGEQHSDSRALRKLRKEAAEHRVAAKEAETRAAQLETELEETRGTLDKFRDSYLAEVIGSTDVSVAAFTAAGYGLEDIIGEDGKIDRGDLGRITAEVGNTFGRTGTSADAAERALQWLGGTIPTSSSRGGTNWGDVLKK